MKISSSVLQQCLQEAREAVAGAEAGSSGLDGPAQAPPVVAAALAWLDAAFGVQDGESLGEQARWTGG